MQISVNNLFPILVCLLSQVACTAQPPQPPNAGTAMRTVIPPEDLPERLGVATVPDRETFERLSYQGPMRMDGYLSDIECVKFIIVDAMSDSSKVYWMNTENIQAHPQFMGQIGLQGGPGGRGFGGPGGRGFRGNGPGGGPMGPRQGNSAEGGSPAGNKGLGGPSGGAPMSNPSTSSDVSSSTNLEGRSGRSPSGDSPASRENGRSIMMRGAVSYFPRLKAPDGSPGLYVFDFQPNDRYSFEQIRFARNEIVRTMPFIKSKLAFHPLQGNLQLYQAQKEEYSKSDVAVFVEEETVGEIAFLPLNIAVSFGRLKVMDNSIQPSPREIVICQSLPNQMPRVAGVVSAVRQTPLSHVNLRAIQDKVPNAFVAGAMNNPQIQSLVGKLVRYEVSPQGYRLREANQQELDQHFDQLRPKEEQTPYRDLTVKEIKPLREINFQDSCSFGTKTANLATMLTFDFPDGTIPDGWAVPFYFYDEFMKHNALYEIVNRELAQPNFQSNRQHQIERLKHIQKLIVEASMPDWMLDSLGKVQNSFPEQSSIRCRSSTNNEDLPGFSGAGLYDSFTHRSNEGHLCKTIKKVYASLWNFRAFEEREFYRVNHQSVAMGVLLHGNFKSELANGVGVTDDILYLTKGNYYLNAQLGEDLVTNPNELSSPEEILLGWYKQDGFQIVRPASSGKPILPVDRLDALRDRLARIHQRFRILYGKSEEEQFAMEIEFKIDKDGRLVIKQARPWVF